MHLKKGTLLKHGDYRIESVLGQGGFGITYLAYQIGLDRKVAIKEFFMSDFCERDPETSHVSLGTSGSRETVEKFKAKFIKEAQTIARLDNPHIIRIHDVFEENDTAYYVMEYHGGGTLADLVKDGGGLPERQAVHYIRQIADALQYIHERSMNHLDVKPGNVLLDEKGNAMLIDFGLSKRYDAEGNQTTTTPVGFSHGYAPFEQYKQGGVGTFSPATDIYSLGATLYKLVTGETPPEADVVGEDGIPALPSSVSPSVVSAIEKSMQFHRKNRLQSVEEFLALLDAPAPEISRQEKTEMEHSQKEETKLENIDAVKHEDKGDDGEFVSMFAAEEKTPVSKRIKWILVVLCLLLAIAGIAFGLSALLVGGETEGPSPVVVSDSDSAQVDAVDEETVPRTVTAVDLGLSVKWADRNVGADSPEDNGKYFVWGETKPGYICDWDTYKWCNERIDMLTKYCTKSDRGYNGFTDGKTTLDLSDDAAYVNMGSNWRMPTIDEIGELMDECTWIWTTQNSKEGYKVTGPNGKSIFLPAAGYRSGSSLYYAGSDGYYWSSSLDEGSPDDAWNLNFDSDYRSLISYGRYGGRSVRAVVR